MRIKNLKRGGKTVISSQSCWTQAIGVCRDKKPLVENNKNEKGGRG